MFIPYGRIILRAWLHISNHAGGTDNKFFHVSNDLLSSYNFLSTISLNNEPDSYIIWCDPEDEGSMFLQNVGIHMQKHIVSQHRRLNFEQSLS
jgi:hypothetical protein